MAEGIDAPAKDAPAKGAGGAGGAWGQAMTAVVLVGALGVGLWTIQKTSSANSASPPPATCPAGQSSGAASRYVSAAQLCDALNRTDLAQLLGTPGEIAKAAGTDGGGLKLADGTEIADPSARVEFATYTVSLSATYDHLPVTGSAALLGLGGGARQRTVLGRPAVLYADRTIRLSFRLDGSDSRSGPGVPTRVLSVAMDAKDSGGSFDVTLWRADGMVPDDAVLLRLTETLLPTIPGWTPHV